MILTAAHCVKSSSEGKMASSEMLSEPPFEEVTTAGGATFRAATIFVETVSDIAVLSVDKLWSEDLETFQKDHDVLRQFCAATRAIPLSTIDRRPGEEFPVRIRSHEGELWRWSHVADKSAS
jgi:hypothetical protein